jgi:hypothetical protein
MSVYEIRERADGDGSGLSLPFIVPAATLSLVDVLRLAVKLSTTVDIMVAGRYIVSYCGAEPYWWLPGTHGGGMHQMSSLGWCHTCRDENETYVHHLDLADEIAVLTETAITDHVLRRQVEADGQTPAEYAEAVAGKAIAKDGDAELAIFVQRGGTFLTGHGLMRQYAVHMRDRRTVYRVAVPYDNRPEQYLSGPRDLYAARDLAEKLAHERPGRPRRCYDCRGLTGHAHDCSVTREREFLEKYPHLCEIPAPAAGPSSVPVPERTTTP